MRKTFALLLPLIDLAAVIVFALTGRSSHAEGFSLSGLMRTAGPFFLASAAASTGAHLLGLARPSWKNWLLCAVTTVALGMVLRVLFGAGGAPASFVVVASSFFLLTMGLSRLIAARALRRNSPVS